MEIQTLVPTPKNCWNCYRNEIQIMKKETDNFHSRGRSCKLAGVRSRSQRLAKPDSVIQKALKRVFNIVITSYCSLIHEYKKGFFFAMRLHI